MVSLTVKYPCFLTTSLKFEKRKLKIHTFEICETKIKRITKNKYRILHVTDISTHLLRFKMSEQNNPIFSLMQTQQYFGRRPIQNDWLWALQSMLLVNITVGWLCVNPQWVAQPPQPPQPNSLYMICCGIIGVLKSNFYLIPDPLKNYFLLHF